MRVYDFISEGGQLFSNTATYPEWLTGDMQSSVQDQLFDYALRRIQPRLIYLAEKMDIDLEDMIQAEVHRRIERNNYKYVTLLATESFEYNPIENYNMIEAGTTTAKKGQQQDTDLYGQDQTSTLYGHTDTQTNANTDTRTLANSDTQTFADTQTQTFQNTDTRTMGNSDTLTLNTLEGEQTSAHVTGSSSATEGARSDSTTKSMYGYNSTDPVPSEVEGFSKGAQQNSATSGSDSTGGKTVQRTGTETTAHSGTIADAHTGTIGDAHTGTITDAHSGTITDGHTGTITNAESGTDTTTRQQHTDTHTSGARDDSGSHSLTRSGNIGVQTTQSMILQEREVANFSFLKILTEDLVNSFCLGVM